MVHDTGDAPSFFKVSVPLILVNPVELHSAAEADAAMLAVASTVRAAMSVIFFTCLITVYSFQVGC
jgi:hypothetical protein